jgi:hypothetical protein
MRDSPGGLVVAEPGDNGAQTVLHARVLEPDLGLIRRRGIATWEGELYFRGRHRLLLAPLRRLGDGRAHARRARRRGAGAGRVAAQGRPGTGMGTA